MLSRHGGLRLGDADVFVSVAGGARAIDPAADLAIALAVASAHRGVPVAPGTAAFGELGLTGAVRPAGHAVRRLAAAAGHGIEAAIMPPAAHRGPPRLARTTSPACGAGGAGGPRRRLRPLTRAVLP